MKFNQFRRKRAQNERFSKSFLVTINDWPTYNQELISEFLDELNEYYGILISLEKIDSKIKTFEGMILGK